MPGNSFGEVLRLSTFGESHGPVTGGVLDGYPSNIFINRDHIQKQLGRRFPAGLPGSTARTEKDEIIWLSGIEEDHSTGGPIAFMVENRKTRPEDYAVIRDMFRPSHGDYTWFAKYGRKSISGGGRSSGRETVSRIIGGELARLILNRFSITVHAYVIRIGNVSLDKDPFVHGLSGIGESPVYCPSPETSAEMVREIIRAGEKNDTLGGIIQVVVKNVIPGLGEPVFDKLHANLGKAVLSIPSAKGVEFGLGFDATDKSGSWYNDPFGIKNGAISAISNHDGGIQGGMSNGNDILFRIAFKPVPSIGSKQKTVDIKGNEKEIQIKGRHDVCAVPRIVPVAEAMTCLVLSDHLILQEFYKQFK